MKIKILVSVLVACFALCSCVSAAHSPKESEGGRPAAEMPKVAGYAEGDLDYTVTVSDERRSVTFDVSRKVGITNGTITSPEEIAGLTFAFDGEDLSLGLPGEAEDVVLSGDAAAGLLAVLGIASHRPVYDELTEDGCFSFVSEGWDVCLILDAEGYPSEGSLTRNGAVRRAVFAVK